MNAITSSQKSLLAAGLVVFSAITVFGQGSLTPPGPPGPTMKTLDQLDAKLTSIDAKTEKRTPIDAAHLAGDSYSDFVITEAGSYYLTGNLVAAKDGAITVKVPNVTIDLNGFTISKPGAEGKTGNGTFGISVETAATGILIKNGTFTGLGTAVSTGAFHRAGTIQDVNVSNGYFGIWAGDSWIVERCNALDLEEGIIATEGCIVRDSTAAKCKIGFIVGGASLLNHCAARENETGIFVSYGGEVVDCISDNNSANGIRVNGTAGYPGSVLRNNRCAGNAVGFKLESGTAGCVVDSNQSIDNNTGFSLIGSGNLVIRNTSRGGTTAFNNPGANSIGPLVNVYNANASTTISTTNPWANFLY